MKNQQVCGTCGRQFATYCAFCEALGDVDVDVPVDPHAASDAFSGVRAFVDPSTAFKAQIATVAPASAPRVCESRPSQNELDIEANEPRLRRAMSAIGILDDDAPTPPLARIEPDWPLRYDGSGPRILLRPHRGRWTVQPEGYLPKSEFDRFVRCLSANGAHFNAYGAPKGAWVVTESSITRVRYDLVNCGFSIDAPPPPRVAVPQAAPSLPSSPLPSTVGPLDVLDGVASATATGGRR